VAERGKQQAQRSRLAHLLSERSDTLIMLSATPHDGRSESFASLMNMLDPTAIANPHDYTKDDIKGLCIRRFKKDIKDQVQGSFKERKISIEKCSASPQEEYAFDIFTNMKLEMDEKKQNNAGQLFKTSLEKSMFSSPAACIKSIDERLSKLNKKYDSADMPDIFQLEEFKRGLEKITPKSFSRYQKLLELINSEKYGWSYKKTNDRIVIFTERIETMRFLVLQLCKDLSINEKAIQEIYGGMSDNDQQKIVEDFGREESPIRILVASDVASEGINLHYLSHRLIHFDIPWSLMVFQQRNGRIDRYGQHEQPDIRYFMISTLNEKIKGDIRIMEILVSKEEQAYKNIGDPALIFGKFNVEEEEQITAEAIEKGISTEKFIEQINDFAEEFNPFELLMMGANETAPSIEIKTNETLYKDIDYVQSAMTYFTRTERHPIQKLQTVEGIEIELTPDLKRRLLATIPEEAMPSNDYLRLSPDKSFCMQEMKRSMQNNMSETAWPKTQYLWSLHPIFGWINDKAGLLFGRNEAPLVGISGSILSTDHIYIVAGTIPNRKSTPVIDEWFGLYFSNGRFVKELTMNDVIGSTHFGRNDIPNRNIITEQQKNVAVELLEAVVDEAKKVIDKHSNNYIKNINPKIDEEIDKLIELESRHKTYQISLFENERKKSEQERKVEKIFGQFTDWVKDTLEIEKNPYIRIIAVLTGV
jgi:hypothetical protein